MRAEIILTLDGVSGTTKEWCAKHDIKPNTFRCRLGRGWDMRAALTTPEMKRGQPNKNHKPIERRQYVRSAINVSWDQVPFFPLTDISPPKSTV